MTKIIVDSHLCDMGTDHGSAKGFTRSIIDLTLKSWAAGADLVLFPEYTWYNLVQYRKPQMSMPELAQVFWSECWPLLIAELKVDGKAVILGSTMFEAAPGKIRNRSPMIVDGKEMFQDKLCMTPWESTLDTGDEIQLFEFKGARWVNMICLDIEIPATAALIKEAGPVDVVLVPSATQDVVGVERIARCASARSVELGAAVIVSQLVGELANDDGGVDVNMGQASFYLPSLRASESVCRIDERGLVKSGNKCERFVVDLALLRQARDDKTATNPALAEVPKKISVKS